jgi:hypothetical protein
MPLNIKYFKMAKLCLSGILNPCRHTEALEQAFTRARVIFFIIFKTTRAEEKTANSCQKFECSENELADFKIASLVIQINIAWAHVMERI